MQHAQKYYWIIIVAFSLGFYLKTHLAKQQPEIEVTPSTFQVPSYISLDTVRGLTPYVETGLRSFSPSFLGKHPFGDTLVWREARYSLYAEDYLEPYYYYDSTDHLATDGLQLIPRPDIQLEDPINKPEEGKAYFPVFVVNETSQSKVIHGKEGHTYAIQEARDSSGYWHPIEHQGIVGCGVGRWILQIHPNEYGAFLMPVYEGNYATELRVRFKNGQNTTVSKPYKGRISYEQFFIAKKSWYWEWYNENPIGFTLSRCYGSYLKRRI
ncbi:MAG: hypothetical protein F6K19_11310 [Cyanothece sp. SIO1E1]|nr:hypothetical protein [Cyanothece sp. SIO1E1]